MKKTLEEKRHYRAEVLRRWRANNPERASYHNRKYRESRKKKRERFILRKPKKVSAKERIKALQKNQNELIKRRDLDFDQYIRLSYPFQIGKRRQKKNYLAYLNREADFLMYLNMKELSPAKWKRLQFHLEAREVIPMKVAAKIREQALTGKRYIGYPPYVPNSPYDKTLSPIYQAAAFGKLPNHIIHHEGYYLMRLEC